VKLIVKREPDADQSTERKAMGKELFFEAKSRFNRVGRGGKRWNMGMQTRGRDTMCQRPLTFIALVLVIGWTILLGGAVPLHAEELVGRARIIDGDTIEVRGKRIRLYEIDAPESRQQCLIEAKRYPCGKVAAGALEDLTTGTEVRCRKEDMDRYGRIVAVCFVGGQNLNAWMVAQGWALAYRRYSLDCVDDLTTSTRRPTSTPTSSITTPSALTRAATRTDEPPQRPSATASPSQPQSRRTR
jgi:endonuclease YncB( thermonuclease family)